MEPSNPIGDSAQQKSRWRYILLGAFNAVAALLISIYSSGLKATAGRSHMLLVLVLGLAAGALGGFCYHKIISTRPGTGAKILASVVYLALVLAAFAFSIKGV